MVERLLVSRVSLLQIVHHEIAVTYARVREVVGGAMGRELTETTPDLAIGGIDLQDGPEVFDRLWEMVLRAQDGGNAHHGGHRPLIVLESLFIALVGTVQVLHLLRQATCSALVDSNVEPEG